MQEHLFFITKRGLLSIGNAGIVRFSIAYSLIRGTDTITPYQLIDDSFLEIIKEVARVKGFIPTTLYKLMRDQKGQYCLIHLVPEGNTEAIHALFEAEDDFKKLLDLLNSGKEYEEAKREVFKHYVLDTDTKFTDSPDAGNPKCLCSRCGERIYVGSAVIRKWPTGRTAEYRFHPACLGMVDPGPADWSFIGYECQKCGHRQQEQGDCAKCSHWHMEELHRQFNEDH